MDYILLVHSGGGPAGGKARAWRDGGSHPQGGEGRMPTWRAAGRGGRGGWGGAGGAAGTLPGAARFSPALHFFFFSNLFY